MSRPDMKCRRKKLFGRLKVRSAAVMSLHDASHRNARSSVHGRIMVAKRHQAGWKPTRGEGPKGVSHESVRTSRIYHVLSVPLRYTVSSVAGAPCRPYISRHRG